MALFTFDPLTPAAFLRRSAAAFPSRVAVIDGTRHWTYAEFADRCSALRGALGTLGIGPGDRVAALCANSHVMLEMHHAVPAHGAVLVPINVRLALDEMAYVIVHSGAQVIVSTAEFAQTARRLAGRTGVRSVEPDEYEDLLARRDWADAPEIDERGLLAINYTSGTICVPQLRVVLGAWIM